MCQFHSFLFDNYTGDIYDAPNHVSHAVIAEKHGLNEDDFWGGWFNITTRQVYFNGQRLQDALSTSGPPSGWPRPLKPYTDLAMRHRGHDPWNQQALDCLERCLKQRFGTAERLVDFVGPQWRAAQADCALLLAKHTWPKQLPTLELHPREARFGRTFNYINIILYGLPPAEQGMLWQDNIENNTYMIKVNFSRVGPLGAAIPLSLGPRPGVIFGVYRWEDDDDLPSETFKITLEYWPNTFEEWKSLFLVPENRIPAWQQDPKEMLAL